MVIFWFWFLIPQITGQRLPEYAVALTAFVVFEAAYLGEIVRAGIQSVSRGQSEAATATGLSHSQTTLYVILPREIRPFEMYLFLAVAYWICTYSMSRLSRWLEVRMSPEKATSKRAALRAAARTTI